MKKNWPTAQLGEVLKPVERSEVPKPGTVYRQIGVKLWGMGAYERKRLDGSATRYTTLYRAEAGDVIVNKIWARNGSIAVVPDALARCYGSGEFPMFSPNQKKLDPLAYQDTGILGAVRREIPGHKRPEPHTPRPVS
jgi:type I restriction enzyme, S subunit